MKNSKDKRGMGFDISAAHTKIAQNSESSTPTIGSESITPPQKADESDTQPSPESTYPLIGTAAATAALCVAASDVAYKAFGKSTSFVASIVSASIIVDAIGAGMAVGIAEAGDPKHKECFDGTKVATLIKKATAEGKASMEEKESSDAMSATLSEVRTVYNAMYDKIQLADQKLSGMTSLSAGIAMTADINPDMLVQKVARTRVSQSDVPIAKTILAGATIAESSVGTARYFVVKNFMFVGAAIGAHIGKTYLYMTQLDPESVNPNLKQALQITQSLVKNILKPCGKVALLGCYTAYQLRPYIATAILFTIAPHAAIISVSLYLIYTYPVLAVIGYGDGMSKTLLAQQKDMNPEHPIYPSKAESMELITIVKEGNIQSSNLYDELKQSYRMQREIMQKTDDLLVESGGVAEALEAMPIMAKTYNKLAIRGVMIKVFGKDHTMLHAIDIVQSMLGAVPITAAHEIYKLGEKMGEYHARLINKNTILEKHGAAKHSSSVSMDTI